MILDNVNVDQLRQSVNICKKTINCASTKNIINKLDSNNLWSCESKLKFKNLINKLYNDNYCKLQETLDSFSIIFDDMESYISCSSVTKSLEEQYENLSSVLLDKNKNGDKASIHVLQNKIQKLNDEIKDNKMRLYQFEEQIKKDLE